MRTQTGGSSPNAPSPMRSRTRSTQPTASSGMDESSAVFTATRTLSPNSSSTHAYSSAGSPCLRLTLAAATMVEDTLWNMLRSQVGIIPDHSFSASGSFLSQYGRCSRMRKRMTFRAGPSPGSCVATVVGAT